MPPRHFSEIQAVLLHLEKLRENWKFTSECYVGISSMCASSLLIDTQAYGQATTCTPVHRAQAAAQPVYRVNSA